ncbi:hypothetical protein OPV22_001216 [Ensete ventricosum]|uniref:Uncharacterized protein n=1 Tax=Ensete ventricosum TaxID=4639 RepID=A0AAV8RU74_ENSVE|nr:hypothetical protein OPV22_001216 [Ensete ventricosum]
MTTRAHRMDPRGKFKRSRPALCISPQRSWKKWKSKGLMRAAQAVLVGEMASGCFLVLFGLIIASSLLLLGRPIQIHMLIPVSLAGHCCLPTVNHETPSSLPRKLRSKNASPFPSSSKPKAVVAFFRLGFQGEDLDSEIAMTGSEAIATIRVSADLVPPSVFGDGMESSRRMMRGAVDDDVLDEEEGGSERSSGSNSPREVGEAAEKYQAEDSTRVCIVFLAFDVFFIGLCVSGMYDWYCCLLLSGMSFLQFYMLLHSRLIRSFIKTKVAN